VLDHEERSRRSTEATPTDGEHDGPSMGCTSRLIPTAHAATAHTARAKLAPASQGPPWTRTGALHRIRRRPWVGFAYPISSDKRSSVVILDLSHDSGRYVKTSRCIIGEWAVKVTALGAPRSASCSRRDDALSTLAACHIRMASLFSREAANLVECPSQRVQSVVGAGFDGAGRYAESLRGLRYGGAAVVAFEQDLPVLGRQGAQRGQ
jgi:hypothetical protein